MRPVLCALLALLAGCERGERPSAPEAPRAAPGLAARPDLLAAPDLAPPPDLAPIVIGAEGPRRLGYVGAAACEECHPGKHARWERDWHARALAPGTADAVVGDFKGAHFRGTSSEAWMMAATTTASAAGGRFRMRTAGADGRLGDYPVDWVIGGKRMQDTVTVLPDGRFQVLPVYYHVTGRAWVDYTESKQGPIGPGHPFFWSNFRRNANHECLDCHATGLLVTYDRAAHAFRTEMADAGVGCESCHGPGARHAETQRKADIVNPARLDRERALAVCAACHGPRKPLFPILDLAHRFRPGERYDASYQALVVVDGPQRSGDYFADGRPRTSSFEYQALVQSRCYRKGGATCLSCHSAPHADHEGPELRPGRAGDGSCKGCHPAIVAQGKRHSRHQGEAAQRCAACHMPPVISGVLDHLADHALDVPAPENTARHGVPSACGECHEDRAPAELAASMDRLWPGSAARRARRLRLADAFDEKTAAESAPALRAVLSDGAEAPTLRGAAAVLLAQRFPREIDAALPLLRAPDPLLRQRAVEAVGFAGARQAADAVARLADDPALAVRHTAALVLFMLDDARAEAALRRLAEGTGPGAGALPQPQALLGLLHARRGDREGAVRLLERAVDLMPYYGDALLMLAQLYQQAGQPALARARAEEALRFDPQSAAARRFLR